MINLNNLIKILFLLILSSCTITSIETIEDKKIANEVPSQEYFKKADVNISPLVEYDIDFRVLEKFVFDEKLHHKLGFTSPTLVAYQIFFALKMWKIFSTESQINSIIYEKCKPFDPSRRIMSASMNWGNVTDFLSDLFLKTAEK
mgnify:CR=1 FL=1